MDAGVIDDSGGGVVAGAYHAGMACGVEAWCYSVVYSYCHPCLLPCAPQCYRRGGVTRQFLRPASTSRIPDSAVRQAATAITSSVKG